MPSNDNHQLRDTFLKLVLLLVGYGLFAVVCFAALGISIFCGLALQNAVLEYLGKFPFAKAIGFLVVLMTFFFIMVTTGLVIGFVAGMFQKLWPNNPLLRLIQWVKVPPPYTSGSDY